MRIYFWGLLATMMGWAADTVNLQVEVKDERRSNCRVYVAVYRDPKTWLSEKPFRYESEAMKGGAGTVQVANLPAGKYAILAYCDRNGNGKLDENLLGIPKEPYGFSNGTAGKFELSFMEAAFEISPKATPQRQEIVLVLP